MTGQRHNPRECWCGIDHSRCAKCGGPTPNELLTCSLDECPHGPRELGAHPSPECGCDICALVKQTLGTFS